MSNKIIAVGPHYKSTLRERGITTPYPLPLFLKPISTIVKPKGKIMLRPFMKKVVAECEIVLKIGEKVSDLSPEEFILGDVVDSISLGLDVTLLDEGAFANGKIYDTFTPLGEFKNINPYDISFEVFLNNESKQKTDASDIGITFEEIISYCSKHFTLFEGDMILAGTPAGAFEISSGDQVTIVSNFLDKLNFYVGESIQLLSPFSKI